jgi:hypothetical protein
MNVKKLLIGMSIAICLAIPVSVFAVTSDTTAARKVRGFFGIDISKLTSEQKGDLDTYTKKMADLQKEMLNKMVENKTITKEQADAEIKKIDEAVKNGVFPGGFGGRGPRGMGDKQGPLGMGDGLKGMFGIDTSKLTDKQKSDFKAIYEKIGTLQKEYVKKQVASGLLTKDQGDAEVKEIEACIADGDFLKMLGRGGFGMFGKIRKNPAELTAQQKTDLEEFKNKIGDLQKELINKAVSNGAITKAQGDTALAQLEKIKQFELDGQSPRGFKKGGFSKGHGKGMDCGMSAGM